jgi:hypothetical protein
MKKYLVKTRNWHSRQFTHHLIALAPHERMDFYTDSDGKFIYQSNSLIKSLLVWAYWQALAPWSKGWTYIINQHKYHSVGNDYKSMYL